MRKHELNIAREGRRSMLVLSNRSELSVPSLAAGETRCALAPVDMQRAVAEQGFLTQRGGHVERPLIERRATVRAHAGLRKGGDLLRQRHGRAQRLAGGNDAVGEAYAYEVEGGAPMKWDDEAKKELGEEYFEFVKRQNNLK